MIKKCFVIILISMNACVAVPPGGGGAFVYNDYTTIHTVFPIPQGELTASSTARCYLSLVCLGNISPHSIAIKNGIEIITAIDYEYTNINIFYSSTTLIVHGRKKNSTDSK
ncbi:TRL-like family protein [Leptospira ellinghausenii]|uniref:TRL-like family protein n=1 Tax=Leptospira ellinghausenii TaxID=1917822 RepID=A0A2P2DJ37_9LEPT|nr:TRL domain-containing protein [Leptospira ellinghausenii]GBF44645.1 TRL-like family protein [Leptospira ellinghausenii]